MAFCLPVNIANKFLEALKNGEVDPGKLSQMSSAERHAFFSKLVGEENAKDVNALFESKLLLKNQQAGMIRWAKQISGITEPVRQDILSTISKLSEVLTPENEKEFLADLVSKKLGAETSVAEANKISELAQKTQVAKAEMLDTPANSDARRAYGRALIELKDYTEGLKPEPSGWGYWTSQIANLPRTMLTSIIHFSAPFVQGWGMMGSPHYVEAWGEMFKYFASEDAYKNLQADIYGHPDYKFAMDGKLSLTNLSDKLSEREEAIQSSLLEKIPGLGKLPQASGRSFTGFLNYVRFNRFVDLLNAARMNDEDVRVGSQVVKDIAATVNDFTGRGALPGRANLISQYLNAIFFSSRKISGSIRMLNPVRYIDPGVSATARMGALRQISGTLIATGAILELAHLAGANVNMNPTDTDFLKVKAGNIVLDVTGGNSIYLRLLARLVENQEVTSSGAHVALGAKFGSPTRASLLIDFTRDKFAPLAGAMADFLYGKDPVGQPFSAQSELYDKFVPIAMQDFINLWQSKPTNPAVWVPALSAIFGVDVQVRKK